MATKTFKKSKYKYGFKMPDASVYNTGRGLSKKIVEQISYIKGEPEWMRAFRLKSYESFRQKPMPTWGADLSDIRFKDMHYYVKPIDRQKRQWKDVPSPIRKTFDKLGIPEAERKILAGVGVQYDSEVVYHSLKEKLKKQGIIFLDTDTALKKYPEIFKQYFGKIIPPQDNKFAALNSAVWSGGSFIYVPPGVKVELPLQAYFRINLANMGQFERTLIIADKGSYVHYIEGCTAPIYTTDSLHAGVVEIVVKEGARVRYTTIQNWSNNVYNLVTKRMRIEQEGFGEWVDCNLGSKVTMKYPSFLLMGKKARGDMLSMAYASKGQHLDAGAKVMHMAPETSSKITSKSISQAGGRTCYRGLIRVYPAAEKSKSKVVCDALILDRKSRSDTYPTMKIDEQKAQIEHEATVTKLGEEQLFYLMSRGLNRETAESLIINGFIEQIIKELPLEYAVEMNRLVQLQMEGGVG